MHLILARRDLTGFQHLHPDAGRRRHLVARRAPRRRRLLPAVRRLLPRRQPRDARRRPARRRHRDLRPLPAPAAGRGATAATTSGSTPATRVPARRPTCASRSPATARRSKTEPYLGAGGHLVALREGDMAFLHVHPMDDGVRFAATFPTAGRYRLFLQFQHEGRVQTVAFTQEVGDSRVALELPITGMTCASCANRIERRLNKLDGVTASVNYATEKATVDFDPAAVDARRARGGGRGGRLPASSRLRARRRPRRRDRRDRAAAPPPAVVGAAVGPGAGDRDDPAAAVRQLAVAGAAARHARSSCGARGRSTAPRGRTSSTAPRRWTR